MKGLCRYFSITVFTMLFAGAAFAQVDSVKLRLIELGIDSNIIEHSFHTDDGIHYFKMTVDAVSPDRKDLQTIEYDPRRDDKQRWQFITYNGDTVSEKWAKDYAKEVNKNAGKTVNISSAKIKSEDKSFIVISFQCGSKDNLPDRYKNLSRCAGLAFINKNTKQIEREEFTDSSSFQLEFMDVRNYTMYRNFAYNEDLHFNQLISDDLIINAFIKDKKSKVTITYIYSDYKAVQ
jgi:hypothetical protein